MSILYSSTLDRYYTGSCDDIDTHIKQKTTKIDIYSREELFNRIILVNFQINK